MAVFGITFTMPTNNNITPRVLLVVPPPALPFKTCAAIHMDVPLDPTSVQHELLFAIATQRVSPRPALDTILHIADLDALGLFSSPTLLPTVQWKATRNARLSIVLE